MSSPVIPLSPAARDVIPPELVTPPPALARFAIAGKLLLYSMPLALIGALAFFGLFSLVQNDTLDPLSRAVWLAVCVAGLFEAVCALWFVCDLAGDEQDFHQARDEQYVLNLATVRTFIANYQVNIDIGEIRQGKNSTIALNALPTAAEPPEEINADYQLAVRMLDLTVRACQAASGKKPRLKPYAFDNLNTALEKAGETGVGAEAWAWAVELLERSGCVSSAARPSWAMQLTPLTVEAGLDKLHSHLAHEGYAVSNGAVRRA